MHILHCAQCGSAIPVSNAIPVHRGCVTCRECRTPEGGLISTLAVVVIAVASGGGLLACGALWL